MIKHLLLLKIRNMVDMKEVLLQYRGVKNENISNSELAE